MLRFKGPYESGGAKDKKGFKGDKWSSKIPTVDEFDDALSFFYADTVLQILRGQGIYWGYDVKREVNNEIPCIDTYEKDLKKIAREDESRRLAYEQDREKREWREAQARVRHERRLERLARSARSRDINNRSYTQRTIRREEKKLNERGDEQLEFLAKQLKKVRKIPIQDARLIAAYMLRDLGVKE